MKQTKYFNVKTVRYYVILYFQIEQGELLMELIKFSSFVITVYSLVDFCYLNSLVHI